MEVWLEVGMSGLGGYLVVGWGGCQFGGLGVCRVGCFGFVNYVRLG